MLTQSLARRPPGGTIEPFTVVFVVVNFPTPWPPELVRELFSTRHGDQHISVAVAPDGHLIAAVSTLDGDRLIEANFARVELEDGARGVFMLMGEGDELSLRINRVELDLAESSVEPFTITAGRAAPEAPLSYEHPEAATRCAPATEVRARRFRSLLERRRERASRRPKTQAEQVDDFRRALLACRTLASGIRSGHLELLPTLATELRGLVYWPNDSPTWDPLLYRLADWAGLALPVWADTDTFENLPEVVRRANAHVRGLSPSTNRRFDHEEIVDLQEYLDMPVLVEGDGDVQSASVTGHELVGAVAHTMGPAHYDPSIELSVERLDHTLGFEASLIQSIVLDLTHVVVELGEYVLRDLER